MAEIIRYKAMIGFRKSNKIIRHTMPVAAAPHNSLESDYTFDDTIENNLETSNMMQILDSTKTVATNNTTNNTAAITSNHDTTNKRSTRRYYIDELGFYRLLDLEQKQYLCSNLTTTNIRSEQAWIPPETNSKVSDEANDKLSSDSNAEEGSCHELTSRALMNDLGISHFDRTNGYEDWKKGWDDFMRNKLIKREPVMLDNKLKQRVRSGIPQDYRCKVWTALIRMRTETLRSQVAHEDIYNELLANYVSKVEVPEYGPKDKSTSSVGKRLGDLNNNKNSSNNKYQPMTQINVNKMINTSGSLHKNSQTLSDNHPVALDQSQEQAIEKFFKQIELDLLRTLPNNRHFEDPNSIGIQRVRRVLRAYACFNPEIGYCQGMNRLAAMALLVLPEEEAFWCLVAIIQCIMPKDYYLKPWLAQVDCCVLSDLMEKKMPTLHKHLTKNDIQLTLFTWFFTIFVDGFKPELMLRIWDCFLCEGDKVLFRFALSILYIYQNDLLEMNDFSTMSTYLSRLVSTTRLDVEYLFETFSNMNPLSSATLESRRNFHRNKMQSIIEDK